MREYYIKFIKFIEENSKLIISIYVILTIILFIICCFIDLKFAQIVFDGALLILILSLYRLYIGIIATIYVNPCNNYKLTILKKFKMILKKNWWYEKEIEVNFESFGASTSKKDLFLYVFSYDSKIWYKKWVKRILEFLLVDKYAFILFLCSIIFFPGQFLRLCILAPLLDNFYKVRGYLNGWKDIFFYKYFGWDSREFFNKVFYYYYKYIDWIPSIFIRQPLWRFLSYPGYLMHNYVVSNMSILIQIRFLIVVSVISLTYREIFPIVDFISVNFGVVINWKILLLVIYAYFLLIWPLWLRIKFYKFREFDLKSDQTNEINQINEHPFYYFVYRINGWNFILNNNMYEGFLFKPMVSAFLQLYRLDPKGIMYKYLSSKSIWNNFFWLQWFYKKNFLLQNQFYNKNKNYVLLKEERGYKTIFYLNEKPHLNYIFFYSLIFILWPKEKIENLYPLKIYIESIKNFFEKRWHDNGWYWYDDQVNLVWYYLKMRVWFNLDVRYFSDMPLINWNDTNLDILYLISELFLLRLEYRNEEKTSLGIFERSAYKDLFAEFYIDSNINLKLVQLNLKEIFFSNKNFEFKKFKSFKSKIPLKFESLKVATKLKYYFVILHTTNFFTPYEIDLKKKIKFHENDKISTKLGGFYGSYYEIYNFDKHEIFLPFILEWWNWLYKEIKPWILEYYMLREKTPEFELVIEKFQDRLNEKIK